jgi:hypothetical protein
MAKILLREWTALPIEDNHWRHNLASRADSCSVSSIGQTKIELFMSIKRKVIYQLGFPANGATFAIQSKPRSHRRVSILFGVVNSPTAHELT